MSLTKKKCAFLTLLLSFSLWQMTKEILKSFPDGILVSVSAIHGVTVFTSECFLLGTIKTLSRYIRHWPPLFSNTVANPVALDTSLTDTGRVGNLPIFTGMSS